MISSIRQRWLATRGLSPAISSGSWKLFQKLLGSQLGSNVVGVATLAVWSRFVDKSTFGEYQVVTSFIAIVGNFCLNGLSEGILISAAKNLDGNLKVLVRWKTLASIAGSVALGAIGWGYWRSNPAIARGIWIVAALFPLIELNKVWSSWVNGKRAFDLLAFLQILFPVATLAVLGALIVTRRATLPPLVAGVQGSVAVLSLATVIYIFRSMRTNDTQDRVILHYGFHVTAATFFGWLVVTDKAIVNQHLSAAAVAVYSVALVFPDQLRLLYGVFSQMLAPQMVAAKSVAHAWDEVKRKLVIVAAVFLAAGVAGFFLIPMIIPVLFTERYAEAAGYGKWLWLSMSITAPATYCNLILRSQRRLKIMYGFEIVNSLVTVGLFLWLIRYGIGGMITAHVVRNLASSTFFVVALAAVVRRDRARETRERLMPA